VRGAPLSDSDPAEIGKSASHIRTAGTPPITIRDLFHKSASAADLIWINASWPAGRNNSVMPEDEHRMETIREIERLRVLADWYRGWALTSGSEEQRSSRLGLADHIDAKARALMHGLRIPMGSPEPI
jgi:hypothetical protein